VTKLLFYENLSHRLVLALGDIYPDSEHVRDTGLKSAADTRVWEYAKKHDFTIVSKDADFHQRSLVHGFPPKVIWIRLRNCSTAQVVRLLHEHANDVERFGLDSDAAFLALSFGDSVLDDN
jgi:predicted nuclease of predicted toxin-antitoxin system